MDRNDWLLAPHEAEPILQMVRDGRSTEEIEAVACPRCGAHMRIFFEPGGAAFVVGCSDKKRPHFSKRTKIPAPPHWWKTRVADCGPVTFFWPSMCDTLPDGTLEMRVTGWNDEGHWNGLRKMKPDAADFAFWQWIVSVADRWDSFFSDRELPKLREEFQAKANQSPDQTRLNAARESGRPAQP